MSEKGYIFTEADRREFNRIRHKVDSMRGPGINNGANNISFAPQAMPRASHASISKPGVILKPVDTVGCGHGFYRCKIVTLASPPDTTASFSSSVFAVSGSYVYALNSVEDGTGTNDLTFDGSALPIVFEATPMGSTAAGAPLYLINAVQYKVCTVGS